MDFTFKMYEQYVNAIKTKYPNILLFKDFIHNHTGYPSFALIRHDVDRKPKLALKMANLEKQLGIQATYYFRMKPSSFDEKIIKEISKMGHEIGYHYECLSDTNGNLEKALNDFEKNLEKLRKVAPIKTISMHGRPLKPYDNRDMWKADQNHKLLKEKFDIEGEVYLDIDYTDIAYINDTGRNWTSTGANLRDKVNSQIKVDFNSGDELLRYLNEAPHKKLCFQVHPERWSENPIEWFCQYLKDSSINMIKWVMMKIRGK
jgi:hypothetical protein